MRVANEINRYIIVVLRPCAPNNRDQKVAVVISSRAGAIFRSSAAHLRTLVQADWEFHRPFNGVYNRRQRRAPRFYPSVEVSERHEFYFSRKERRTWWISRPDHGRHRTLKVFRACSRGFRCKTKPRKNSSRWEIFVNLCGRDNRRQRFLPSEKSSPETST